MPTLMKKPTEAEIKFWSKSPGPACRSKSPSRPEEGEEISVEDWYASTAIVCRAYRRAEQQQQP